MKLSHPRVQCHGPGRDFSPGSRVTSHDTVPDRRTRLSDPPASSSRLFRVGLTLPESRQGQAPNRTRRTRRTVISDPGLSMDVPLSLAQRCSPPAAFLQTVSKQTKSWSMGRSLLRTTVEPAPAPADRVASQPFITSPDLVTNAVLRASVQLG